MLNKNVIEEINSKVSEILQNSPAKDVEKNMRAVLSGVFSGLDLVTREEFDVQHEVLLRTREKLIQLEAKVRELEQQLGLPEAKIVVSLCYCNNIHIIGCDHPRPILNNNSVWQFDLMFFNLEMGRHIQDDLTLECFPNFHAILYSEFHVVIVISTFLQHQVERPTSSCPTNH